MGNTTIAPPLAIGDMELVVRGRFVRTVSLKEEWDIDVDSPRELIAALRAQRVPADLFTFAQRLPYFSPKFSYRMELDNVAAIPISSYDEWWTRQVTQEVRNKFRKSVKRGVTVRVDPFDDDLVRRIKEVYDDSPVRQGSRFTDYDRPFEEVKAANATFVDRADFLGAYCGGEFIGFLKIVYTRGYARVMGIVGKISQRDKAPMNALMAKAVELCASKNVPYLTYGKFIYGTKGADSLTQFKKDLGFQRYDLPRYYVPLTARGRIFLALGVHKRFNEILPSWLVRSALKARSSLFALRSGLKKPAGGSSPDR
jgi:hypothetical protein